LTTGFGLFELGQSNRKGDQPQKIKTILNFDSGRAECHTGTRNLVKSLQRLHSIDVEIGLAWITIEFRSSLAPIDI
jgi:hypothetical protein